MHCYHHIVKTPAERFTLKKVQTHSTVEDIGPCDLVIVTVKANGSFWLQSDPETRFQVSAQNLPSEIRALRIYEGASEVQQLILGKAVLNA